MSRSRAGLRPVRKRDRDTNNRHTTNSAMHPSLLRYRKCEKHARFRDAWAKASASCEKRTRHETAFCSFIRLAKPSPRENGGRTGACAEAGRSVPGRLFCRRPARDDGGAATSSQASSPQARPRYAVRRCASASTVLDAADVFSSIWIRPFGALMNSMNSELLLYSDGNVISMPVSVRIL